MCKTSFLSLRDSPIGLVIETIQGLQRVRIPEVNTECDEVHDHRSSSAYNECASRNVGLEFPKKAELVKNTSAISSRNPRVNKPTSHIYYPQSTMSPQTPFWFNNIEERILVSSIMMKLKVVVTAKQLVETKISNDVM